ncbi:MAG: peptidylprolyl isomerase [Candidatus Acidiferrales bacterium]
MKFGNFPSFHFAIAGACLLLCATQLPAQTKPQTVEEIVARVNNQIITLSDYRQADRDMRQGVAQDCQSCAPDKVQDEVKGQEKDLLRNLIDNLLLEERAKDMGISVETDVIKQLDDVRRQNGLDSMEALQKAVESGTGMSWEDYKQQIRNQLLRQKVIEQEVSGKMNISPDQVQQYYAAHKDEFVMPEQVVLSEIFLGTQGRTPEEVEAIHKKAEDLHGRIVRGADFTQIAQRYSEGQTAHDGGNLGSFKRGILAPQLDDAVFKLQKGQVTGVIQTKTGFEILRVDQRYQSGQQPLAKVETQIENKLYMQQMEPALRQYLAQLREESYITIKPGYVDSAAVPGQTAIEEVPATPDEGTKKKKKVKLPKISGS